MSTSTSVRAEPSRPVPRTPSAPHGGGAHRTTELLILARRSRPAERRRLLEEVVTTNMGIAASIAARYRARGIASDDLQQVAHLALVKAADGFDPLLGHDFWSYAAPTISGEIKRHFRDQGWMIRPPRRIQEIQARITKAEGVLAQSLGHSPGPDAIAAHLAEPVEDVVEALAAGSCFTAASLDRPAAEDSTTSVGDLLGDERSGHGAAEARLLLAPVVRLLSERDRRILALRYFRGWTQREIAVDIGVTQMQVSRLLSRIMSDLRSGLEGCGAAT